MSPLTLMNLFSTIPEAATSGRSTPGSIGDIPSGRTSTSTVASNASSNISYDTQVSPKNPSATFAVMDLDELAAKKGGRERESSAYSTTEHVALLSIMCDVPDSFNALESSPQWEAVFKWMQEQYYLNKSAQTSSALHGHFVDMYSAFRQVIRQLSLSGYDKKPPSVYVHGDPEVRSGLLSGR
jgi:hypothetical protein